MDYEYKYKYLKYKKKYLELCKIKNKKHFFGGQPIDSQFSKLDYYAIELLKSGLIEYFGSNKELIIFIEPIAQCSIGTIHLLFDKICKNNKNECKIILSLIEIMKANNLKGGWFESIQIGGMIKTMLKSTTKIATTAANSTKKIATAAANSTTKIATVAKDVVMTQLISDIISKINERALVNGIINYLNRKLKELKEIKELKLVKELKNHTID